MYTERMLIGFNDQPFSGPQLGVAKSPFSIGGVAQGLIRRFALLLLSFGAYCYGQFSEDEAEVYDLAAFEIKGQQLGYHEKFGSTAIRSELPILETPQSLFIINDALIEDQQAFRFDQILQNDASVQKRNNFLGAYSSYYLRGFNLQNGTNYLRNGRSFFHLASVPVEILQRTEVLKGPSSVLYGSMAPGGVINMVTKSPLAEPVGFVKATLGSDSLSHFHLDTGGPITLDKSVRYRANLVAEDSEYFRSFGNGDPFDVKRRIAHAALDWEAGENTLISFNFDVTEDDRPQDIGIQAIGDRVSSMSREVIISQPWTLYNSDVWNAFIGLEHYFKDTLSLRAGYNFQDYKRDRYDNQIRAFDGDSGDITIRARRRINRWDYHTFFADLGGKVSGGAINHNFLVGIDQTVVDRDNNETSRNETFGTNIHNPVYIDDPMIDPRLEKNLGEEIRNGIFLQDMIEFGEKWRALIGLRYDDFDSNFFVLGNPSWNYATDNLTPRVGLVHLPNSELSVYASYSESFEPNSPVGAQFDNSGEELVPTLGKMLEVGLKREALDGRLLFAAALFTIDRDGDPVEEELTNRIVQRGLQRNKGAEISVSGLINENLSLNASGAFLDAEFVVDDNPGIVGNAPAGAADVSLSLWAEYQVNEGTLKNLSLQGGWFYEADRPGDNANSFTLDAYNRFDVGLKYVSKLGEKNGMVYRLTISNAFDEEYFKADRRLEINVERPREIRASIQYTF